jgi:hypothetical protein
VGKRNGHSFPADLYLEGTDQHRGWFQSSLLTSVATIGNEHLNSFDIVKWIFFFGMEHSFIQLATYKNFFFLVSKVQISGTLVSCPWSSISEKLQSYLNNISVIVPLVNNGLGWA